MPYDRLRARLVADGQVLDTATPAAPARPVATAPQATAVIDTLEAAVAELVRREQLTDPAYWLAQSRAGLIVRGARLREPLIRAALRQGGPEAASDIVRALATLRARGVFDNAAYWETRLVDDLDCDGKITGNLLIKLARLP